MRCRGVRIGLALGGALGAALLLMAVCAILPSAAAPAAPTEIPPQEESRGSAAVCFWSAQGVNCVERSVAGLPERSDAAAALSLLMTGPTPAERARGLRSAIPAGFSLDRLEVQANGAAVVFLDVPPEGLRALDHEGFEMIVEQIAWTLRLASVDWRDLRVQARHPTTGEFVPLAAFLPAVPAPRKETVLSGEQVDLSPGPSAPDLGQPSSVIVGGQPSGALSGKTVYVSAGHGWQWSDYAAAWRTQRPPYPYPPYPDPIIEDHNNAEAVNQYLLRYLWNAGAQVWPARERDMGGTALIVDDDAPTSGGGYRETGAWATAAVTGTGYAGGGYRWTPTVTGTATASATWTITPPVDGRYAVYVWYRPGSNRASDARYTIHHAGGETAAVVDQRHHGLTWHYLGTFGFRGGEAATVTLSNLSAQAGWVVVADAVRLGGGAFDDLEGIETAASYPPDKPWWEVAAFYYVQRMGMGAPPGDVTARPIYARWEHAGSGDDAVYLSWHSNGATGYQTSASGSETYVHNGEGLDRTEGSLELAHAVHTELVHDLRVGWDAGWVDRGKKQRNLGELRLLWDDDPEARMPGALVEVAFHDHPTDTDALKEPYFNMLAARAMYQGIVRYFEQRDGVNLTLLPEPPTHLCVVNAGAGRVVVRWTPPVTDAVGLGGDAATGYRVYTSADGLGWSNGVAVTGMTAYTITGLADGDLLFVRVAATNEGGESLPTEVLGVRVGVAAGVLLVNGFDRLNRTLGVREVDPVEGYNVRMLLDRMNRHDYVIQYGQVITHPFDSASNEAVQTGEVRLDDYAVVVWMLGEESVADETLSAVERAALTEFLGRGGALFLSGTEIGWHLDYLEGDPDFYTDVLRASYDGDDAETYLVTPTDGAIFEGLPPFRFDAEGMYDADSPDRLLAVNGSLAALSYSGGLGGTAAVQYESDAPGCERLVYFGFPFETIWPHQRPAVMGRVLDFLGQCLPAPVRVHITTPIQGSVHITVPFFAGTAEAGGGTILDRVEVQVQRGRDGGYWTDGSWTAGEAWVTATGTAVWSYPLPALSDGDYTVRAQAWTVEGSGVKSPPETVFTYDTLPPAAPVLITPTGGIALRAPVSVTLRWTSVEPDGGSPIAYEVMLDGRFYTTTQTAYTPTHVAGGWRTWGARAFDAAGHRSAWVTDTFCYPSVETVITAPADGSAHNRRPLFAGTAEAEGVTLERVEVQIQRAVDGRYWVAGTEGVTGSAWITGSAWVTATTWVTAAGMADWSYPLPWLEDSAYHLQARSWTMDGEVDLSPAAVGFTYDTRPPASTVLITPTGGVTLPARPEVALVWQPILSDTGSPLVYVAELDGQFYTTTRTTYTAARLGGGWHRWGVQVWDAAGNCSGWVTATFAVRQYNAWLPVVMRNLAPAGAAVLVNGGFETDEGWTLNQLAVYDTERARSGARSARMGILPEEAGSNAYSYSSVAQTFVVPSGVTVTLRLWAYPIGGGGDSDDWYYVSVRDAAGALHTLERWQSDARVWEEREYALGDYRGQEVRLYLGVRNDGDDDTAALYVDDVSVTIEEVDE